MPECAGGQSPRGRPDFPEQMTDLVGGHFAHGVTVEDVAAPSLWCARTN